MNVERASVSVFISHSTKEAALANALRDWLRGLGADAYCSSKPPDLAASAVWFNEICVAAANRRMCMALLSPDSAANNWIHFESGIVLGARIKPEGFSATLSAVAPVLYGGMKTQFLPPTLKHFQALDLNDAANFDAFLEKHILRGAAPNQQQDHTAFLAGLDRNAKRLLEFGQCGLFADGDITTDVKGRVRLESGLSDIREARICGKGELVAVRAAFEWRGMVKEPTWKFGLRLVKRENTGDEKRVFEFHAGCHDSLATWTLRPIPETKHAIEIPAQLTKDQRCTLQLWLDPEDRACCVGIDAAGIRTVIRTDTGEDCWSLADTWSDLILAAWNDDGRRYRVDVLSYEFDWRQSGSALDARMPRDAS